MIMQQTSNMNQPNSYQQLNLQIQLNQSMSKKNTPQLLKSVSIPEDRGKSKACVLCLKEFSLMNTEHQCKRCRRPVCEKCSPHKAITLMYSKGPQRPHRQCNFCKDESGQIQKFISDNQLAFLKDTLSINWLHTFNLDVSDSLKVIQLFIYIYKDFKLASREAKQAKDQSEYNIFQGQKQNLFLELESSSNYSLREFYDLVLKNNQNEVVYSAIEEVLDVFYRKFPDVGYHADLVMITLFLLCFSSVSTTYTLLSVIYSHIVPSYLYNRSMRLQPYDFSYEIETVMEINNMIKRQVFVPFLQKKLQRYFLNFSLNFFMFETSFLIINEMLSEKERGFERLIKCLAVAVNLSEEEYKKLEKNQDTLEVYLLRNSRASKVQNQLMLTKMISLHAKKPQKDVSQNIVTRSQTLAQEKETKASQQEQFLKQHIASLENSNLGYTEFISNMKNQLESKKAAEIELKEQILVLNQQLKLEKEEKKKYQEENINIKYQYQQRSDVSLEDEKAGLYDQINSLNLQIVETYNENLRLMQVQAELSTAHSKEIETLELKLRQNNILILNLQQQNELEAITPRNNATNDTFKLADIIMQKNATISELTACIQEKEHDQYKMQQSLNEQLLQSSVIEMKFNDKESQLSEVQNFQDLIVDLRLQVSTLKLQSDRKDQELKAKLKDVDEIRELLLLKNQEIVDFKLKIIQQETDRAEQEVVIADKEKQLLALQLYNQLQNREEIRVNQYIINVYGKDNSEKQLDQDIQFLIKDVDPVRKRIILGMQDTIISQNRNLRFQSKEKQGLKDEFKNEQGLMEIKQQELQAELDDALKELEEKNVELGMVYKEINNNKKSSSFTKRKTKENAQTLPSSNMTQQGQTGVTSDVPVQNRLRLMEEREIVDENKQGCTRGSCEIY